VPEVLPPNVKVDYDVASPPSEYDVYEATLTFKDDQEEVFMRCYRCYLLILLFCYLLSYQTAAINSFLEHNISYPTKQNFTFS